MGQSTASTPSTVVLAFVMIEISKFTTLDELEKKKKKKKLFFHIVLERNMVLHPRHFGRNLRKNLVFKLTKDVEGTCKGRNAFMVVIMGIKNIGKGLIKDGIGFVTFHMKYHYVLFRPFKKKIWETVVTMVNKMGFFAEIEPVQIFISNHLIPNDMEFHSEDMPNYDILMDKYVKTQKDSEVCLKTIGTRVNTMEIFYNGTIKDDFLRVINNPTTS
ncbi:DNA-directed RNA polymerase II subunit RPB7-like [Durio zibethinus]|uniref:DNA-directed RNA polymerase subunit n=1 Tax=Durio zibethinus TaxID=66656 RepID=A0A6P5YNY3_DURZI|nr:DNA-directed RNA polymerase II subunit RPB7-like [Durio zibethinus]